MKCKDCKHCAYVNEGEDKTMRDNGFYWVRCKEGINSWAPAEYVGGWWFSRYWWHGVGDEDLEIDERRIIRECPKKIPEPIIFDNEEPEQRGF